MRIKEYLLEIMDCKTGVTCPPENDDPCAECRTNQTLTYLKAEIEKCLLTDEEIRAIWSTMVDRHGSAQRGLIGFDFEHTLAQAQVNNILKLLGE